MIVSANELESLLLKAVRGAGLSWGLAEEAAAAGIWLARADLLLVGPLVARLEAEREISPPVRVGHAIQPVTIGTALCPIRAGAWIADQGSTSQQLDVRNVLAPLWLTAVVARALPQGCKLEAEWQGVRLLLDRAAPLEPPLGSSLNLSATASGSASLTVRPCAAGYRTSPPKAFGRGISISDADWNALQAFERRTYVPASERSRLAGAGAGLLDDD